jgi:hypothetical protein
MNLQRSWRIGALAAITALTSTTALSAPAGAATTAQAAATPAVEVCGQGVALVKPGSMILTCADDGELAQDLHWTSWTPTKATATGIVTWRECRRLCATSRQFGKSTADYTLSDPVRSGDKILFTRLELHATGTTPKNFQRNLAFDEAPVSGSAPKFDGRSVPAHGITAAPSGSLGYAEIEGYWLYAGGPNSQEGSYNQAQIAAAITGAESSFLPGIIQPGVDYCGAGSDRAGWGLWQITCGNSVPQYGSDFQVLDPWNNAEAAVYKCDQDASAGYNCFTPWSTWASGAYTQYLSSTGADMSISDPGEYVQINSTPPGTPSSPGAAPGSTYGPPMPNSHPSGVPGNLLQNGSFENSGNGWAVIQPSSGSTNISRYEAGHGAPAGAHDGSWYLATNTNGGGGSIYQDVTVNAGAGASYVGTAWLSAQSGTASGSLCVWGLAAPGTDDCVPYSVAAGTYTKVQVVYDLPAAYSTLRFQIYPTPNGGTTDIDTASLVRNILQNGSFENSGNGWGVIQPSSGSTNISRYEVGHGAPSSAHDGSWYLATNTNGGGGSVYQDVTVNAAAGASYVGTAWLSSQSGTATGSLCVWGLASPGTDDCVPYSVTAGRYTEVQVVYDLPTAYGGLRFQIYPTPNGGTTDLDSASLVQNALQNGSFENSGAGWLVFNPSGGTTISRYEVGHGAPAVAHDGSWYLATNTSVGGGGIYQDTTVNGASGDSYVATVWLSSQGGTATGRLCLWGLGSPGVSSCIGYSVAAGTYTQEQVVLDLPAAYSTLRFQLYPNAGGGTTDLDSASIS